MERMKMTRRRLIAAAAGVPMLAAGRHLRVVVTGGHPGDPEYGCGGTVARYTDAGHDVTLLYLNRGQKTCPETEGDPGSRVRVAEAEKACNILGAKPAFAGQCDAHSVVDNAHYDEFRRVLDGLRPDVVFTHWPIDQHRDHTALSLLVHDCWLKSDKRFGLYYYEVGEDTMMFTPTEYVDITAAESRRRAACYAHASQSPDRFYPEQVQISRFRGVESGYGHAEAFIRHLQGPGGLLP
ncbi:MAG TPA: PIG-L family deacetylase [Bryobacteraceae bacterium]|nr:PIG-L family deacetylase [Bryobacteraceae bacterium]